MCKINSNLLNAAHFTFFYLFAASVFFSTSCSSDEDPFLADDTDISEETIPLCGNGILEENEECDRTINSSCEEETNLPLGDLSCLDDCTFDTSLCYASTCGDNILEGEESCDDGNLDVNDGCDENCVLETCGNDILDENEACDGDELNNASCEDVNLTTGSPFCSANCLLDYSDCSELARCGDGNLDSAEECDDENNLDNDGCAADCILEICGDEIIQNDETCDTSAFLVPDCPNNQLGMRRCLNDCSLGDLECAGTHCGDEIIDFGESCDLGSENGIENCSISCESLTCNNEFLDSHEICDGIFIAELTCQDFGFNAGTLKCDQCVLELSDCHLAQCGDGSLEGNEKCDDGNRENGDGCSSRCAIESCGNQVVDENEICDEGSGNSDLPNATCRTNCQLAFCGDGIIDANEMCDNGIYNSDLQGSSCHTDCLNPECGDGVLDQNEDCDDGDLIDDNECSNTCNFVNISLCMPCSTDSLCGSDLDHCVTLPDGNFCASACQVNNDLCPEGYSCQSDGRESTQCLPTSGVCSNCYDPDNDGYGLGDECTYIGEDCDQTNPDIHSNATEICDGYDNNCDGFIDKNVCPYPVNVYENIAYMFVQINKTWNNASSYCENYGYHLVTINDEAENNFLMGFVSDNLPHSCINTCVYADNGSCDDGGPDSDNSNCEFGTDCTDCETRYVHPTFWIGLSDKVNEGVWVWQSESEFTNWGNGEPNNSSGLEDCAEMWISHGSWNDHNCEQKISFVCEGPI